MPVRSDKQDLLHSLVSPESVAVIGATDRAGSVGHTVLQNLIRSYKGNIYAVNPCRREVCGLSCYPSVGALPEAADLAVIVIPAAAVPKAVGECVASKVASIVVISAGLRKKVSRGRRSRNKFEHNCVVAGHDLSGRIAST